MIYRNLFILFILLFKKICIIYSEPVVLRLLVNSVFDNESAGHRKLVNEFNNNYAIVNKLNARIYVDAISPDNSSAQVKDYGDTFSSALKSNRNKYDIIHFYSAYSKKYGDYFEDLSSHLAEELKDYDEEMLKKACTNKNGEIVGLPYSLLLNALYSNKGLLKKYNKTVPKTWDELIDTANFIYENESNNNVHIIRFLNTLNDQTSGTLKIHEFINSFRESNELPAPALNSKAALEALEKLKQIVDMFGQEDFKSDQYYFKIFQPTTLFMVFSYISHDKDYFDATVLPGRKENVTGTIINTTNFGINKKIDNERKKIAIEFLKFAASKEIQKKFILQEQFLGGNMKLYEDDDVCVAVDCDILNKNKPFSFFNNDVRFFGNDDYYPEYQYLLKYVFEDKSAKEVLQKVEDFTKIYTFSLKTDNTKMGLIIFIVYLILLSCTILSIIFIFIKKLEYRFIFLSKNLWFITTLGTLILLSSIVTLYDNVTNAKCHLRITLINVGFVLSICPSLHKLIANFPQRNEISLMFRINKYFTIIIIMIFTVALNEIYAMTNYEITEIIPEQGKHFNKCVMENTFGKIIYGVIQFFNFFIIFASLILIFIEWNLKETSLDVKYLATALFMDTLSLILLIIFEKITIKDYVLYNVVLAINIMLFAVSNHIFIYLVRIMPMFRPDYRHEEARKFLGKVSSSGFKGSNKPTYANSSYNKPSLSSSSSFNKNSMAFYSNLVNSSYNNTGTSFYNNMGPLSYHNSSSNGSFNNYPSNINMDLTKSGSSSSSNSFKKNGITKRIMDYHNQTDIF